MKDIEKEIEKTLNSFDENKAVKVKPYFYTRLTARMEVNNTQTNISLKWSIAALVLIVLVNLVSLLSIPAETEEEFDPIEMMASEYSLTNSDIYNTMIEE